VTTIRLIDPAAATARTREIVDAGWPDTLSDSMQSARAPK